MKLKLTIFLLLFGVLQLQSHPQNCEGFSADVISLKCGPDGYAMVYVSGGTAPYSGDGQQVALGYFIIDNLDVGQHSAKFHWIAMNVL